MSLPLVVRGVLTETLTGTLAQDSLCIPAPAPVSPCVGNTTLKQFLLVQSIQPSVAAMTVDGILGLEPSTTQGL